MKQFKNNNISISIKSAFTFKSTPISHAHMHTHPVNLLIIKKRIEIYCQNISSSYPKHLLNCDAYVIREQTLRLKNDAFKFN